MKLRRGSESVRKRQPELILGLSVLVAALVTGIGAIALVQMRQDAIQHARASSANLALTLERSISRNLQVYELSMRRVIDGIKDPVTMGLPPAVRQMVLFDRSINAEDLGSLLATDERGNLVLDSRASPPRPVNVADRDYFQVHQRAADAGTFVSRPFQPRLTADAKSVGVSQRLSRPDGSFAGVVVGTLRLNYFKRLFDGMDLGPGGTLTLLRTDGIVLMRRPYEEGASIGRDISSSPSFGPLLQSAGGDFVGVAAIDGVRRMYSFRRIPGYALIIVVGLSERDVLALWRTRAWMLGGLIVAVDVLVIALSILLSRQWRRRLEMERHLKLMVDTDGLTGLGSRRALDDTADVEWRRAKRNEWPISLLMIDVDYFKQFNDRYGHLAGDDALAAVAACVQAQIRRPGDFAGRYGGEEFAVILPNTDSVGAAKVAHAIRAAVQGLHLPNADSSFLETTITVGVATAEFPDGEYPDLRSFFRAADETLYLGKLGGRNCVALSGKLPEELLSGEHRWAGASS